MSPRRLLAAGAVAYLLALALGAPAELLRAPLQASLPGLVPGPLAGHPVSGRAEGARLGTARLDGLAWRLRPLGLLAGRVVFEIAIDGGPSHAELRITREVGDPGFVIERLDGEIDLAWLGEAVPSLPVRGTGRLVVEGASVSLDPGGWPRSADGRLRLAAAELQAPVPLTIGSAEGRIAVDDARLAIAFALPGDGDLVGEGRAVLAPDGRATFRAELAPAPGADRGVADLLRLAGRPRDDGRFAIDWSGRME